LNKVALRREGLIDERDEKYAAHEARPLTEHLQDYAAVVRSEGRTEKHVLELIAKISRILDMTKMRRISDISLSDVQEAIGRIREKTSTATANTYIQRIKSFDRWLDRDKRARGYVLGELHQKDIKNDRRHPRRRMTDEEVAAVISAAERGPATGSGFSGPDRAMLYRLAHGTGFRASELRSLTPDSFRLEDNPPTVTALACYTKNGQEAVQPIKAALADLLRPWLTGRHPEKPVFDKMPAQ
jgi:integrase